MKLKSSYQNNAKPTFFVSGGLQKDTRRFAEQPPSDTILECAWSNSKRFAWKGVRKKKTGKQWNMHKHFCTLSACRRAVRNIAGHVVCPFRPFAETKLALADERSVLCCSTIRSEWVLTRHSHVLVLVDYLQGIEQLFRTCAVIARRRRVFPSEHQLEWNCGWILWETTTSEGMMLNHKGSFPGLFNGFIGKSA